MRQSDITAGMRVLTPQGAGTVVHPSYCHPYHKEVNVRVDGRGCGLYKPSELKPIKEQA